MRNVIQRLFEDIGRIHRSLGRIEAQLDGKADHGDRISALELWQSWLKGGWFVLAAVVTYLVTYLYGK